MKKTRAALLALALVGGLAACSGQTPAPSTGQTPAASIATQAPQTAVDTGEPGSAPRILIAYFSVPEEVDPQGADAVAGASIVVREEEVLGNTAFMAQVIQQTIGGDLFRIETVAPYPREHEALVDQAAQEQDAGARPALATHVEDPEQYDVVLLGYPNWWGDMPQPLYTFLEEYDFSGKTIIPFCPHGGSGFSRTERTIAQLQPNATVREDGLAISRNDVAGAQEQIAQWAQSLNLR